VNYYIVSLLALAGDLCAKQRELRDKMTTKLTVEGEEPLYVGNGFVGAESGGADYEIQSRLTCVPPGWTHHRKNVLPQFWREMKMRPLMRDENYLIAGFVNCSPNAMAQAAVVMPPRVSAALLRSEKPSAVLLKMPERCSATLTKQCCRSFSTIPQYLRTHPNLTHLAFVPSRGPMAGSLNLRMQKRKKRLRLMLQRWRESQPEHSSDWTRLEQKIEALPDDLVLPSYAATAAKSNPVLARNAMLRIYAMYFFSRVERSEFTLNLLRATTAAPKPDAKRPELKTMNGDGDPIRLARGKRGYVFPCVYQPPNMGWNESGEAKWLRFDVVHLKRLEGAPSVDDKAKEREDERNQKLAQHKYQRGETKKWSGGAALKMNSTHQFLAGDPRITRLEELLRSDLAQEYAMAEGVEVEYGLHRARFAAFATCENCGTKH